MEKVDDCKGAIESATRSEERDTVYAPGKRTTKRRWIWSTSHWQAVEIVFFVILIIVVWGLFALPTLFYLLHTPGKQVSNETSRSHWCVTIIFLMGLSMAHYFLFMERIRKYIKDDSN